MTDWLFILAEAAGSATGSGSPGSPSAAPAGAGPLYSMIFYMALIFFVVWLLMIRPQKKREQEHQQFVESLKPRDEVVTASGLWGEIVTVREKEVVLRVDPRKDVQVTVARHSILARRSAEGETPVPPAGQS